MLTPFVTHPIRLVTVAMPHSLLLQGSLIMRARAPTTVMKRLHGANGPFRSSTRETPEMHVRFLASDVAVMHTRFHIYGDVDESERTSIGIRVVRKLNGRWRTVAVHNTDVRAGRRH